jgi:predicted DNA-binding protein
VAKKRKEATPHLRIRIEPELLARLESSRKAQGRTLTGEIVARIEQTFRRSEDADLAASAFRAAFGGATGDLLRAFAVAIWLVEKRTGKKWDSDSDTAFECAQVIDRIYAALALARPLTPTQALRLFKKPWQPRPDYFTPEIAAPLDEARKEIKRHNEVALEALQKMGMAPSDAEIAEADKLAKPKSDGEKQ